MHKVHSCYPHGDLVPSPATTQASHKEMLQKALDAPPSDEEIVDAKTDAEDSDDDDIGFKKPDAKRRKRGKQPEETAPGGHAASSVSGKRKANQPAEASEAVKNAEACVAALQGLSPHAYWQGTLKAKDVDKRLNSALALHSQLEEHVADNPSVQAIGKNLTEAAQCVTDWMDAITPLRDSDTCLSYMEKMDKDEVNKLMRTVPPDCMHSILVDLGKRLLEDWLGKLVSCNVSCLINVMYV